MLHKSIVNAESTICFDWVWDYENDGEELAKYVVSKCFIGNHECIPFIGHTVPNAFNSRENASYLFDAYGSSNFIPPIEEDVEEED
mgnify:CR=1 FL=1